MKRRGIKQGMAILAAAFLFMPAARAQLAGGKGPLEISADQTLEWHRNDMQYIARGHVIAKQGEATIKADTITADYRQTETSSNDIYRLTAVGNVVITSQDNVAVGDRAVYTVDDGHAVMTGQALKMTSPSQVVTARDNFQYDTDEGRLTANGAARAVKTLDNGTTDIIDADQLSAFFPQDLYTGQRQLEKLTAQGHVVITTPTDILHGDSGEYRAGTQIATVTGHVKIARGPNILDGDKAQINLVTNVSQMISTPGQGRVHGLFYPGSDKPGFVVPPATPPAPVKAAPATPKAP